MNGKTINELATETNFEFCMKRLKELKSIEITKIDKTPMPNWCAEVFFKTENTYNEIREIIDNLRSRGYYMLVVIGIRKEMSILISNIYE